MPLKPCARFVTTSTTLRLPSEAKAPSDDNIKNLIQGDYLKLGVHAHGHTETFWAKFVMMDNGNLVGRIQNDLQYTHHHGLSDEELITIPRDKLIAILDK